MGGLGGASDFLSQKVFPREMGNAEYMGNDTFSTNINGFTGSLANMGAGGMLNKNAGTYYDGNSFLSQGKSLVNSGLNGGLNTNMMELNELNLTQKENVKGKSIVNLKRK